MGHITDFAMLDEFVGYQPPKSSAFGHQAKKRDARKALNLLNNFLGKHTRNILSPSHIHLRINGNEQWTDLGIVQQRIDMAKITLGREPDGEGGFAGDGKFQRDISSWWNLSFGELPAAIEFALDDDKFLKQAFGPTVLNYYYDFHWKKHCDLDASKCESSFQKEIEGVSRLGVFIGGQRMFFQPVFAFPYVYADQAMKGFIREIEPDVPFRFREQYFKRVIPSKKSRKSWRVCTIDEGWLSEV